MRTGTLLLIVDMQNDFCTKEGSLYVNGAEKDVVRTGKFIRKSESKIDHIILTADNHHVTDISHPVFWEDSDGNSPAPFTAITYRDVAEGRWKPRYEKLKAIEYIKNLELQDEFPHVIWPEHCIIGSHGAAIVNEVLQPVKTWARRGNYYDLVVKGTNPLTEHFGALKANIPIPGSPETQLNKYLVNKLKAFERILVVGEAKSHCVAATVKQIMDIEGLSRKLIILEDCMSVVTGFETIADPIFKKAGLAGAQFALSTELVL